jgi:hypothetical protein
MKKGFFYRFFVILIAYVFAGGIVLASFAGGGSLPTWELWTIIGVFLGAFVLTVALNEFIVYRRKNPTKK